MISNTTRVRVRYADTDQLGFVYHSNYVIWFERGRTELLRDIGYPYSQMEKDNVYLPVVELFVRYKKPARYDELVTVISFLKEVPESNCKKLRIDYRIFDEKNETLLTEGYTVHIVVNESFKPSKAPQKLLDLLEKYLNEKSTG